MADRKEELRDKVLRYVYLVRNLNLTTKRTAKLEMVSHLHTYTFFVNKAHTLVHIFENGEPDWHNWVRIPKHLKFESDEFIKYWIYFRFKKYLPLEDSDV